MTPAPSSRAPLGDLPEAVADLHYDERYAAMREAVLGKLPSTFADTRAAWLEGLHAR